MKGELQHDGLTDLIVTKDMTERKTKMIELGDAFIAFPGGTGTLEEIAEVMSKVSLKHLEAPCILYDLDGYYTGLRMLLDHMIELGLSSKERQKGICFAKDLPEIQKSIIKTCISRGKRVVTATQMLESMAKNPRPTRAEVSDVANAVYDGTSAIMLSGETSVGKYPVETVRTMSRIAENAEKKTVRESLPKEAISTLRLKAKTESPREVLLTFRLMTKRQRSRKQSCQ